MSAPRFGFITRIAWFFCWVKLAATLSKFQCIHFSSIMLFRRVNDTMLIYDYHILHINCVV